VTKKFSETIEIEPEKKLDAKDKNAFSPKFKQLSSSTPLEIMEEKLKDQLPVICLQRSLHFGYLLELLLL
jgi:hypothetical protein